MEKRSRWNADRIWAAIVFGVFLLLANKGSEWIWGVILIGTGFLCLWLNYVWDKKE